MMLSNVMSTLKGKYQRAMIWANDVKGNRVEASWTFRLPTPDDLKPLTTPLDPTMPTLPKAVDDPANVPLPSQVAVPSGGASASVSHAGVPKG